MEYRTLGNTCLRVSVLGFGGAEIGYEGASDSEVQRIVGAALDAGINVFDTAECYVDSEQKLGRALAGKRDQVLIFSKCGHAYDLEGVDWEPAMLQRSIDRSLQRLGTDRLDLIQLHSCSAEVLRSGDVIDVLERARAAGKARFIGYSGDSYDALAAIDTGRFDTLQTSVNIADQECLALTLPRAADLRIGVIAKRAIANAAWKTGRPPASDYSRPYWDRLVELDYEILKAPLRTAVSSALRWTLAVPGVNVAIVGTKSSGRFMENAELLHDGPLAKGVWDAVRFRWLEAAKPDWVGQV